MKGYIPWCGALVLAHFAGVGILAAQTNATVRLTGIVSIGHYKRAYLVQEERGRLPEYLTLQEGEKVGSLEMRAVEAESGRVHILRDGKDLWLSFASQETAERQTRQTEKQFVDEHTRAHEALQRRERERLARESTEAAVSR